MKKTEETLTHGSKNVFEDLGYSSAEAKELELRSELMIRLREMIGGKPQKQVAAILGVSQPRVSDLVRGKLHLFSLDSLVGMLERAGATVDIIVREPKVAAVAPSSSANYDSLVAVGETGARTTVDHNDTWRTVPLALVAASQNRGNDTLLRGEAA